MLWMFSGILGLIVPAFMPVTTRADLSPEQQAQKRKTGNIGGVVLTVLAVAMALLQSLAPAG
ncbi:MAG: hypothetical protein IT581_22515 [Verrucomicrobiales bacterium]|nr:hypothetical protein [Verrucomicrobiales bacterium]